MTELEKKMNRVDLQAYKNYDKKLYALVPGINSELQEDQLSIASKYPKKRESMIEQGEISPTRSQMDE